MEKKQSVAFSLVYIKKNSNPVYGNVFHTMDLSNLMDWIFSESLDLPDIFHI